ncbi:metal ABC transporter permease [Arthrobacter sp. TB 23]|uniref:metal ABC transporter permease n=1 Tax=Arthrobacter sp. TB 23 TaxID=494419 RepID=UPI0003170007|nr:metal ABC transporter permease [Arthrobacter sp. TB 23]
MSSALAIMVTAGLTATACGLLGPFMVLRRTVLMADAVSHAVMPGIVLIYVLFHTRAPLPVIIGAAVFAVLCVLGVEALRSSGLVKADAAIALIFPALFSIGVLGINHYASDIHLDLDSTIYGEVAFVPFRTIEVFGVELPQAMLVIGIMALLNAVRFTVFWKPIKVSTFDPGFARTIGIRPQLVSQLLLVAVAVTAVTAFEAVGAILVITLLIVPAATAYLLTDRIWLMITVTVAIGWTSAIAGYQGAAALDASIAGAMGVIATACFTLALVASPNTVWQPALSNAGKAAAAPPALNIEDGTR